MAVLDLMQHDYTPYLITRVQDPPLVPEAYRKFLSGPVVITDGMAFGPGGAVTVRRAGVDFCGNCGRKWNACKHSCLKLRMEED